MPLAATAAIVSSSLREFRDLDTTIDFVRTDVDLPSVPVPPLGSSLEQLKKQRDEVFCTESVRVLDARRGPTPIAGEPTTGSGEEAWDFDTNGFTLLSPVPALNGVDPNDRTKMRELYFPEVAELVRRKTGAEQAFVFNYLYRDNSRGQDYGTMYSRYAHSDYGPESLETLRWMLIKGDGRFRAPVPEEELEDKELCIANLWHPVDHPAYNDPFALLDATSLGEPKGTYPFLQARPVPLNVDGLAMGYPLLDDQRPKVERFYKIAYMTQFNSGASNDSLLVACPGYAPTQRWVYFPDMQPEMGWLFKQYDEREGVARCAFHNSVKDVQNARDPTKPGRRSLEARIALIFPKKRQESSRGPSSEGAKSKL